MLILCSGPADLLEVRDESMTNHKRLETLRAAKYRSCDRECWPGLKAAEEDSW